MRRRSRGLSGGSRRSLTLFCCQWLLALTVSGPVLSGYGAVFPALQRVDSDRCWQSGFNVCGFHVRQRLRYSTFWLVPEQGETRHIRGAGNPLRRNGPRDASRQLPILHRSARGRPRVALGEEAAKKNSVRERRPARPVISRACARIVAHSPAANNAAAPLRAQQGPRTHSDPAAQPAESAPHAAAARER